VERHRKAADCGVETPLLGCVLFLLPTRPPSATAAVPEISPDPLFPEHPEKSRTVTASRGESTQIVAGLHRGIGVHSVDRGLDAYGSHIIEARLEIRVDIDDECWANWRTGLQVCPPN